MLSTPDLAGRALDSRYELRAVIGEGAFGRVYRGFDRRLEREVAVKVIKPWWAEDGAWVERFEREARLLARVNDPGIVQIFDIGRSEEGPYYVAELVEGQSLAERLRGGPMTIAETWLVSGMLCSALASAHARGIVHCDIKPANVLLGLDRKVKIGDFGVARLAEGTSQAISATVAGTPRYMSPEQARGRPASAATDVYSAGVVMYEMLAGEPPFAHGSAVELGLRHLQDPPPPLPGRVPLPLARIIERALEKEPAKRYQDGAEMGAALHEASSRPPRSIATPLVLGSPEPSVRSGESTEADGAPTVRDMRRDAHEVPVTEALGARTRVMPKAPPEPKAPVATSAVRRNGGGPGRRSRRTALLTLLALALGAGAAALLLLAGGSPRTTVPELRGLPRAGVRARARRLHVRPEFSSRYSSDVSEGLAVTQDPAVGTRVAENSAVLVTLSAGPPPVQVPPVVGQRAQSAEALLARSGLRYGVAPVAAPGATPGVVTQQSPAPRARARRGSTVALSIAEAPRWRTLTSFSGVDDGRSVPFRIRGNRFRLVYRMGYEGTCLLLFVCFGPSAKIEDLNTGTSFGSVELNEGESQTHVFNDGPGLFRVAVSGGRDSAGWGATVEDYY